MLSAEALAEQVEAESAPAQDAPVVVNEVDKAEAEAKAIPDTEVNRDMESWTPEERKSWLKTGDMPTKPVAKPNPPADPAPAKPSDKPASEAKEAKGSPKAKDKTDTERRIQDLLKDRADERKASDELRERLAILESQLKKPETKPAVKDESALDSGEPALPEVSEDDFETYPEFKKAERAAYAKYVKDHGTWERQKTLAELEQRDTVKAQTAAKEDQLASFRKRCDAAAEIYDDFKEVAFSEDIPLSNAMDYYLQRKDEGALILYKLGQDVEFAKKISKMSDIDAIEALGDIRRDVVVEQSAKSKPKVKAAPEAPSVVKKLAANTPPPVDVSSNAGSSNDPIESAMKIGKDTGDWRPYMKLKNAAEVAALRGR